MKKFSCINIKFFKKINSDPLKITKRLVRNRSRLKYLVNEYTDSEIINTYKLIKSAKITTRFWEIANYRIAYILKKRLKFVPKNRIIIKIPFAYVHNKQEIKNIFLKQIQKQNNELKYYILKTNTKVVFLRRKNIRNILCNFINFAKTIRVKEEINCHCLNCSHRQIKILSQNKVILNANFIPTPDKFQINLEMITAINNTLYKNREYKFITTTLENDISFFLQKNKIQKIKSDVFKQIKMVKIENRNRVITILDKNAGTIFSFCPKIFKQKICELFDYTQKNSNYKLTKKNEIQIMKLWLDKYKQIQVDLGRINKKGKIPYAYAIPKFKNLLRYRPIMSYAQHPLRRIYNLVSRALFFILQEICPKSVLFNINNLVNKLIQYLENVKNNIYIVTFDIKNMFTALPQPKIKQATIDLLRLAQSVTRRKWITIHKYKKKGVRWGRSFDKRNFVEMHYKDLLNFVELDIFNCYFTIGDQILKQIIGIPMGSPMSPPNAVILCAIAEINFMKQIKHRHIINNTFMTRYIDDGLIISEEDENHDAKHNAHLFIKHLTIYYPEQIKILIETEGNIIKFLEIILKIKNKKILIKHHNKNYEFIKQNKPQKFLNLIHFDSFAPMEQKIGVVIGTMLRVVNLSNNETQKLKDIFKMFWEFIFLGYTKNVMLKIFFKLKTRHTILNHLWTKAYLIIKLLNIK